MKFKSLIVTLSTLVVTTSLLFLIGHLFTIPLLMFRYEYTNNASGVFISTGSIMPLIIGFIISFFAEKIYVHKYRQKLG
ncbi:hypothetical protein CU633_05860 [Bacillus sp. V3-13]|uniref:hypothetical protein n=1 Tax=Bacillus sp. V3-13 TaxID=2053728 RepID=UPI000C794463|nr:hypothetical protein [Bacillus sp. V3-13]PLR78333.1 hypothetical protein CU633_05860 [Bacillus sp. V3-13]